MEPTLKDQSPKPCLIKDNYKRSSTYSTEKTKGLSKKSVKRVKFVDRAQNIPLCTTFNYEKIDVIEDDSSPKRTQSCACSIF